MCGVTTGEAVGCHFNGYKGFSPPGEKGCRLLRATLQCVVRKLVSGWLCRSGRSVWVGMGRVASGRGVQFRVIPLSVSLPPLFLCTQNGHSFKNSDVSAYVLGL